MKNVVVRKIERKSSSSAAVGGCRKQSCRKGSVRKPRYSKEGLYMVATNEDGKGAMIVEE